MPLPRPPLPTLALCALAVAIAGLRYGGFLLAFIVPCVGLGALIGIGRLIDAPEQRPLYVAKLLAWVCTVGLIACVHGGYAWRARLAADALRAQVEAYRAAHGAWPNDDALPPSTEAMRYWDVHYTLTTAKPRLCYLATSQPLSTWCYDFDAARWQFTAN